jgi:hypothetical protein
MVNWWSSPIHKASFWWINRNRSTELNIRRPRTRQPTPALQNSP